MLKSNRDPTQRYKVIIEKPTYAGDEMHSSSVNGVQQYNSSHVTIDTDCMRDYDRKSEFKQLIEYIRDVISFIGQNT